MRKLLFLLLILCFFVGCQDKSPVIETDNGVATKVVASKYNVKFENVMEDGKFVNNHVWIENAKTKHKDEIKIDLKRPIKNLYQRNFTGEGVDEILVVEEPNDQIFEFRVYQINKDFLAEERFMAKGSMSECEYWFLTEDNNLIHLNSIRDYSKEENAVYKSRYECITYSPKVESGKLKFEKTKDVKSKREMDNLKEIKKVLSIPEDALVISNIAID